MIRAAGILIIDKDGKALFLKRGNGGDMPGLWCFPGGRLEDGETALDAAVRETKEEAGFKADPEKLIPWARRIASREHPQDGNAASLPATTTPADPNMVDFTTFLLRGVEPFTPKLGPEGTPEHVAFAWAPIDQPPEPLHPGCRIALDKFGMDELGIARAIAAGDLASPQKYANVWLFDIRITGSGASYRPSRNEFVWRDSSLYCHEEFLARCNGLPVVWEHPPEKPALDSQEFNERIVGTVFLPHIRGEDVWGVAKIYDAAAAELMASEQLSTSPGVVFTAASGNQELKLKDGSTLLIEGKPALLDHIAIVNAGVWDKGGPPTGVSSAEVIMADEKKSAEERLDAAAVMDALKGIADRLDNAHSRLDAMDKARKDADTAKEEEKKEKERQEAEGEKEKAATAKDKAKKDARKDRFGHRKDGETEEEYKGRHDADETAMCDALEKGGTHSKEDARKDAAESRKDAEEEEKKEQERKDAARKDAARHDATAAIKAENAELKGKLESLTAVVAEMRRETPAEERDALAKTQFRADSVAAMFGERAAAPIAGETSLAYRRRALKPFLKHSAKFKEARLDSADSALLSVIEDAVYSDAADASRADSAGQVGILIPVRETDLAGRVITKFHGDPMAWMQPFMGGSYPVGRINRNPSQAA